MSSDIEVDFAQELRAAAESAVQPAPADLYAGAVDRGRRIRRTTMIRRTLAGAATLGVVAAVGIPLGGASNTTPTGATAPSAAKVSATAGTTSTSTAAGTSSGTAWMWSYMVQILGTLLPDERGTANWSVHGGVPLRAFIPELGPRGRWAAALQTDLTTAGGKSTIAVSVQGFATEVHCPSHAEAPHEDCTTTSLSGGTLTVDKGFKNPITGTGVSIWNVYWNGPEGQSVTFRETADGPHQALTAQQAIALVTTPAWNPVWKSLPAACQFGAMVNPRATQAQMAAGGGFVCATSRSVATHIGSSLSATGN